MLYHNLSSATVKLSGAVRLQAIPLRKQIECTADEGQAYMEEVSVPILHWLLHRTTRLFWSELKQVDGGQYEEVGIFNNHSFYS